VAERLLVVRRRRSDGRTLPVPLVTAAPGDPSTAELWIPDERAESRIYVALDATEVEPFVPPAPALSPATLSGAEHVIVATQACLAGARRLAEHRTRTGLRSVAVAATDVYEALADGEHDPQAAASSSEGCARTRRGRRPRTCCCAATPCGTGPTRRSSRRSPP
jgi:hypothetical protein